MELRNGARSEMNYFILVPTLRCNLRCDYCQVSRVSENARGFDWDDMRELGIATMFIRPVNFQGFARKAFRDARNDDGWDGYCLSFLDALIEHNLEQETALSEYYFSYILLRILDPRRQEHVDLRNPNPLGKDYVVIGEKGDLFPSDEARMLFRTGQIDLRIGHVETGLNDRLIDQLNIHADNRRDPDCVTCVYQAVCGRDLVDDISRYGRIDVPRLETRHCQRHLAIFDHIMRKLAFASDAEIEVMARMAGLAAIELSAYR
ncbi:hypothetical protein [Thioclava sp. GXIMD4215]|uniref:hypothetical protein n=1 Tax=Thioclava sp. GXIMD4215 TaxID=3131928 RepID=UPI00311ADEEE